MRDTIQSDKMKPLLCSASVVRNFLNVEIGSWPAKAIDSNKPFQWQDRRPVKPQPARVFGVGVFCYKDHVCSSDDRMANYSPIKVGDVLYVRETWKPVDLLIDDVEREDPVLIAFSADDEIWRFEGDPVKPLRIFTRRDNWNLNHDKAGKWKPSIHMPKWASRIHLEVMRVRLERACDISKEDCAAEGFGIGSAGGWGLIHFRALWDDLYGPDAWEKWVWVYDLKRIK